MDRTEQIGVRLAPDEREALEDAAKADARPPSTLVRKVLLEWLQRHGWIKAEKLEARQ